MTVEVAMIRVCCVCRKVEKKGQWITTLSSTLQKVSHVYCPICYEDVLDKIERYALRRWNKSVYTVVDADRFQEAGCELL